MKRYVNPGKDSWEEILKRPVFDSSQLEELIKPVLQNVKQRGDEALREYTQKFDGVSIANLAATKEEIEEAKNLLDDELKSSIFIAYQNIDSFHRTQVSGVEKVETSAGVTCWRESRPIQKVGLYIPGGTAPLFSTILMLAIPANIAGCEEIVLCTPPNKEGKIHPAILYTADLCGVTKIFKAGGAQAIAAMAYGTESIPAVYKIFGPGNQYVTEAKQMITKDGVAIDMPAGPSEVAVVADEFANPAFVASDLLSQAEHGVDSQVILIATSESVADAVETEVAEQLQALPRKDFASKALENSKTIVVADQNAIIDILNEYAAEHLILQVEDYNSYIPRIINAGSVFLGPYTPESAGDYASGTNHTLPTNGYAKAYSGVSLDSFVKKVTFQEITQKGIRKLGPAIENMAEEEQLFAHKNAVTLRIQN